MLFTDLRLAEPIQRSLRAEQYTEPTPIQAQAIPPILEGRDLLGCAQTGTGKTAAFALPVLHRIHETPRPNAGSRGPRCLVLCPTRELAVQIADSFQTYGKFLRVSGAVVFGGVSQSTQVSKLRRGIDVLIATPGRLLDLFNQGYVDFSQIETLILDEADRMLDMGFMPDLRRIVAELPDERQTLMFSATMPPAIRQFADQLLDEPVRIQIARESAPIEQIEQSVYFVSKADKASLLQHMMENWSIGRAIVFTRTKHGADRVAKNLRHAGASADAIHGNKSQAARQKTLDNFKAGRVHVLVATDVASRGIDVDGVTHVINYDLSHEPECYVHRIGRTARAGAGGMAVSFCDQEEMGHLISIERLIQAEIPLRNDHPVSHPRWTRASHGHGGGKPQQSRQGGPRRKGQSSSAPQNRGGGGPKRRRPQRAPRTGKPAHPTAKG